MSTRETLEQYIKDRSNARKFGNLEAAIRAVLEDVTRLDIELRHSQAGAIEERRRLEAQVERLRDKADGWSETCTDLEDRIDAALKIAERLKEMDQPFAGLGVSLVKALKGEARLEAAERTLKEVGGE